MLDLESLLEGKREEMIRDLRELVKIESVKDAACPGAPFGPGVREALDLVLQKGQAMGFAARNVDGYAGHLEFGVGEELIGVLAHVDVVPAGSGWTHPPFGGEVSDGRLYGRGSSDDKGPVIACLHALATLKEAGFAPRRRLRLILGCDEESGWECVDRYFAAEERPAYGFSPDAEFPLIIAEKGQLGLEMSRCWGGVEAPEAAVRVVALHGGTRPNIVPDTCRARLRVQATVLPEVLDILRQSAMPLETTEREDGLELAATGMAAHASLPQKGVNSIGRLLLGLAGLMPYLPGEQAEVVRFLAEGIGLDYDGSGLGLACQDASGALTLNLGTLSWDEKGVTVKVDIRYPVTVGRQAIFGPMRDKAELSGLRTAVYNELPPLQVPDDHPLAVKLLQVYNERVGGQAAPLAIGGRTYACAIGTGVAFGPVFPGRPEVAHQRDEYIDLDEFMLMAKIYAAAMAALTAE